MLKNIQIHFEDRTPEPTLYQIMEKLALQRPNVSFVHDAQFKHYTCARPYDRSKPMPDEPTTFATRFRVMDNGLEAGQIVIESYYSRRSGSKTWRIGVTSHLINNSRGPRSTVYTSDVTKAVANAKKFLSAKSLGRVMYEQYEEAHAVARDIVRGLITPISRGHFINSVAEAQILLYAYMTNNMTGVGSIDAKSRSTIVTTNFEKALSEYHLANYFTELIKASQTTTVSRMGNLYAMFTDKIPDGTAESDTAQVGLFEFEQLPVRMQEKIGVLQLMQEKELVKDVGVRATQDTFILM